jgi:hypothetical protein
MLFILRLWNVTAMITFSIFLLLKRTKDPNVVSDDQTMICEVLARFTEIASLSSSANTRLRVNWLIDRPWVFELILYRFIGIRFVIYLARDNVMITLIEWNMIWLLSNYLAYLCFEITLLSSALLPIFLLDPAFIETILSQAYDLLYQLWTMQLMSSHDDLLRRFLN